MNVHFIDTSVLVNLLDIPNMNNDRDTVEKEFMLLKDNSSDTLLLSLATIIETGNHIAHISDGNIRRDRGKRMADMLKDMAEGKAPWAYYENEITSKDLLKISQEFPQAAMEKTGIGDLSIISAYNTYKERTAAIGYILYFLHTATIK